ncbi:MAG: hypothetical protein IID40_05700 [Planctomycetes bacterium]|nr:hypothetical protein [Planctomycetota bacterium]
MIAVLLQIGSRSRIEAVQRHFAEGGRWSEIVLIVVGLGALIGLGAAVRAVQQAVTGRKTRDVYRPAKLFRQVLAGLNLAAPQRDLLVRLAAGRRLENPIILLLGRGIFEDHAARWLREAPDADRGPSKPLADLADYLFPATPPRDTSTATGAEPSSNAVEPGPTGT